MGALAELSLPSLLVIDSQSILGCGLWEEQRQGGEGPETTSHRERRAPLPSTGCEDAGCLPNSLPARDEVRPPSV